MKDLGLVLKNARQNKNLTQQAVMEATGINRKTLSGYENNVAEPDLSTFADLVILYGLSADKVLEISHAETEISLSKYERQLLSLFQCLDTQHQRELIIQLRALVNYQKSQH